MQLLKSLLFATCLCSAWAGAYPTSSIPEDASAQHQSRSKLVARRFRSSISHALAGLIGASVGLLAGAAVESGRYKREDRRVWQNYSEALAPLDAYEREVIRTATIREISQWSEVPAEVAKCVVDKYIPLEGPVLGTTYMTAGDTWLQQCKEQYEAKTRLIQSAPKGPDPKLD